MLTALVLAAAPAAASARDPGRWVVTGATSVPNDYFQGLASNPAETSVYFTGFFQGLWKTTPRLSRVAGVPVAIPAAVAAAEGYNHIGDPTWNRAEGGRVILPLECYSPRLGNTCGTGAFGVADPATLAFRYYVKLDPAEIPKAMWAETSPDGKLIWTSSGNDLLAYRTSHVSAANASPGAAPIRASRRLTGAVPPSGITGAVFVGGRLLLAGEGRRYQVWSVNTRTGGRRIEFETEMCGEAEGLDTIPTLGGRLHWLLSPIDDCELTYGPSSALVHFVRKPGKPRLKVRIVSARLVAGRGRARVRVRVTRHGKPVRRARVGFAGANGRTSRRGLVTVWPPLSLPGRYKALARAGRSYGLSPLVPLGFD
ncbi:MAG TPA: hypothetical protein VFQ12_06365 [Thermoleophilaceae bacterium]|nr:hypothetical protein [Thermoleophilaceae bacterium]